eukprot:207089-Amorphochlora_amoeboformis.AAC.1
MRACLRVIGTCVKDKDTWKAGRDGDSGDFWETEEAWILGESRDLRGRERWAVESGLERAVKGLEGKGEGKWEREGEIFCVCAVVNNM